MPDHFSDGGAGNQTARDLLVEHLRNDHAALVVFFQMTAKNQLVPDHLCLCF
jgi:hypothetical protein